MVLVRGRHARAEENRRPQWERRDGRVQRHLAALELRRRAIRDGCPCLPHARRRCRGLLAALARGRSHYRPRGAEGARPRRCAGAGGVGLPEHHTDAPGGPELHGRVQSGKQLPHDAHPPSGCSRALSLRFCARFRSLLPDQCWPAGAVPNTTQMVGGMADGTKYGAWGPATAAHGGVPSGTMAGPMVFYSDETGQQGSSSPRSPTPWR
jgi:hypothetical protein